MSAANVIPTLRYLWLTIRHKYFVLIAGLRTGAPVWRLVIHDWSKFTLSEAPHYGRQFFGDKSDPEGFAAAWLHHQNANPHHWEYWVSRSGHSKGKSSTGNPLPMPKWAVKEMVADWFGASRAYGDGWPMGDGKSLYDWEWFDKNWPKICQNIDLVTQDRVLSVLSKFFGEDVLSYQHTPLFDGGDHD